MVVVVTGGTRGIGAGLVRGFLARGHAVAFSGRSEAGVREALAALADVAPGSRALGLVADVTRAADVQALWDAAVQAYGRVDIWVNNAGLTHRRQPFTAVPDASLREVIDTNLTGTLLGSRVALAGMRAQGGGKLFNMEGFGSDGLVQAGMAPYGTSKRAVRYLTRALVKECRGWPVVIGTLSPGIVVTDLLTRDLYEPGSAEFAARRRFLDLLADRVETVAPFLVDGMLAARRSGADVRWMGPMQALGRVAGALFRRRDPFATDR